MHRLIVALVKHRRITALLQGLVICLAIGLSGAGQASAADTPLWFEDGHPNAEARQAVDILVNAATEGLAPQDYLAADLQQAIAQAAKDPALAIEAVDQLDQALTAAMQHYLSDLHFGRVDPHEVHENYSAPPPGRLEPATYLRNAVQEHRLHAAIRQAAPPLPAYASLRQALAQYRKLLDNPAWQVTLPPLPSKKLEAGQSYAGMATLTQRLIATDDLPAATKPPQRYTQNLVDGIRSFQERHGLTPDGVIGKLTIEQLNIPPIDRVRQIELTLERLRWTPLLQAPRIIVINIPEFMLRAYETSHGITAIRMESKVIVGKAMDTRTPIFDEDMRYIEFSPYWNIPPSIARAETVPKLRRDPDYFLQQGFEFVATDGRVLTNLTAANLDAVLRGQLRIRQRPGPENALGDIKFIFPNNDNIYLHHTPAPKLFQRDRRDFSHGCIRVEEPVELAKFVLQDQPEWDEERIREAMTKGISTTLRLKEPLPVVIAYATSVVKNDGRIYFFPDIYGHDKLLDEALRQHTGVDDPIPKDQPETQ